MRDLLISLVIRGIINLNISLLVKGELYDHHHRTRER